MFQTFFRDELVYTVDAHFVSATEANLASLVWIFPKEGARVFLKDGS